VGHKNKGVFMSEYEIVNNGPTWAEDAKEILNDLAKICRERNEKWWVDIKTKQSLDRNKGELIALMHSELSEALEGVRKNLQDEKLPHRKAEEVELADLLIRVFDYCGAYGLDVGGAFVEKMAYNETRKDHSHEARLAENGKKF
jgi:NTP pyrophosphatase (non-canonical NTP hydrolase)